MRFKAIISVALCATALLAQAQQVSVGRAAYTAGDNVTITYSDIPAGTMVSLYKGLSYQPMRYVLTTDQPSGEWIYPDALEPGDYEIRCKGGGELLASAYFRVNDKAVDLGGYRIVVLSDIHVMAPNLLINDGSAFESHVATDRKMLRQSAEIFTTMVDSIITLHPDLVLISGDLTKDGELDSHLYVVNELDRLRSAGIPSLVVPGNHDCNNPGAKTYDGDTWNYAPTVTRDDFASLYAHYGYSGTKRDDASLSYIAEPMPGMVILALDSNEDEENTLIARGDDTNSSHVGGRLKPATLQWACNHLKKARNDGKQVITMLHHHLVPHFDKEESLLTPYLLENAATAQQQLMQAGAEVVLTGHFHVQDIAQTYNSTLTDSLVEVSSGALVGYPHPFRTMHFNPDATELQLTTGYIASIPSMPDLQVQSQAVLARAIPSLVRTLVALYWPRVIAKLEEKFGSMDVVNQIMDMPEDAAAAAVIANNYLEDPARRTYLLMTEGNENLKRTDDLRDDVMTGFNAIIDNLVKPLYRAAMRGLLLAEVEQRFGPVFESVYGDINAVGTAKQCQVNDLYATLSLTGGTSSAISEIRSDAQVVSTYYVNLTGQRATRPWPGINIVVEQLNDGTTRSSKMLL